MKARHVMLMLLVVGLAFLVAGPALADTDDAPAPADKAKEEGAAAEQGDASSVPSSNFDGAVFLGGVITSTDGNLNRVGEYEVLSEDPLPRVGASVWGNEGTTFYDLSAWFNGDADAQRHSLVLDFNRMFKVDVSYRSLPHRLDHDPLTYADAAISSFVVRSDDFAPGAEYSLGRDNLSANVELALPGAEGLSFHAGFDRYSRGGHTQAITSSKCANCHLSSYTREMDEVSNTFSAGAKAEFGNVVLDYLYKNRSFEERGATLAHTYDDPLHPVLAVPVFGNRIILWGKDGPQPFLRTPDHKKESHSLRATVDLPSNVKLQGSYAHVTSTNQDAGIDATSNGFKGRIVYPLKRGMTLTAQVRHYRTKVDDFFVDLPEPVSPGGPTAGQTFSQFYPDYGPTDYLRQSSRSRKPTELKLDWSYRLNKKSTLQLGFEHEQLERDNFHVDKTVTDKLLFNFRTRTSNQLKFRLRGELAWIDDPFANIHAAIPAVLQPGPSPGLTPFLGLQYFEMYGARQANLTSLPDQSKLVDGAFTWSPSSQFSLTGHMRWRDMSTDLNFSSYERDMVMPGAEIWWMPDNRWALTLGYNYMRDVSKSLLTVLAFDG